MIAKINGYTVGQTEIHCSKISRSTLNVIWLFYINFVSYCKIWVHCFNLFVWNRKSLTNNSHGKNNNNILCYKLIFFLNSPFIKVAAYEMIYIKKKLGDESVISILYNYLVFRQLYNICKFVITFTSQKKNTQKWYFVLYAFKPYQIAEMIYTNKEDYIFSAFSQILRHAKKLKLEYTHHNTCFKKLIFT